MLVEVAVHLKEFDCENGGLIDTTKFWA